MAPQLSDVAVHYEAALLGTAEVVAGLKAEQLAGPTPCTEWDVRRLLHHVIGGNWMFATMAAGGTVDDLIDRGDFSLDPRGSYVESAGAVIAAWRSPGAMSATCHLPFGDMPAPAAMALHFLDNVVHGWDLARATDQTPVVGHDVAATAMVVAEGMVSPALRATGVFGPEVAVAADASTLDRLVAFLGRSPT